MHAAIQGVGMRIVMLCPSLYSESSCAMAMRQARSGYVPIGVVTLPAFDLPTLTRKLGQWGARAVMRYAKAKLSLRASTEPHLRNPYLQALLTNENRSIRSLREVAALYGFPILVCKNQNASASVAQLKEWSPDLIVFTGGNILRSPLLDVPRLGVINLHLGLLPEIRGMSSPEWSLLNNVAVGVTVHYINNGIDTGPVLGRFEFPHVAQCSSLDDLRNRLIAFGIEKVAEIVAGLDRGTISAKLQSELDVDHQYFVMHEWLKEQAAQRLKGRLAAAVVSSHE
jgi:methionyl-tRNA formyltransferase